MFGNLGAFLFPNSFKLENFLEDSNQYTIIRPWLATRIANSLKNISFYQTGECAKAYPYSSQLSSSGTVIQITDDSLAESMYLAISQGFFKAQLDIVLKRFSDAFYDIKFFVDSKHQKVLYIFYKYYYSFEHSKTYLENIFENLQYIITLFSTTEHKINIDYTLFFKEFFKSDEASLLGSFFSSIVVNEVEFTTERLRSVIDILIENASLNYYGNSRRIRQLMNNPKVIEIPGMYINAIDSCFADTWWSRTVCLNILKFTHTPNVFTSYSDFFVSPNGESTNESSKFNLHENFVYDETLAERSLKLVEETNELISYRHNTKTVIKLKDASLLDKFLEIIENCENTNLLGNIEDIFIVANLDNTTYYIVFVYNCHEALLGATIPSAQPKRIASIIKFIASLKCKLTFKADTDLLEHFELTADNELYLAPSSIAKLDLTSKSTSFEQPLLIVQIIKRFIDSKNVSVDKLFCYCFMKLLPYTFASNLIEYLKTGVYTTSKDKPWGKVLTSPNTQHIKFLERLSYADADAISFFQEAESLPEVKAIISKRSISTNGTTKCYIHSSDCLKFIQNIGLKVSDDTLNKIFDPQVNTSLFLTPSNVIISRNVLQDGNYKIIGVIWNTKNLHTIKDLIAAKSLTTKSLYTMIGCLVSEYKSFGGYISQLHNYYDLEKQLVDSSFKIIFNRNIIDPSKYKKSRFSKPQEFFDYVSHLFRLALGDSWNYLEHFTYSEMISTAAGNNIYYAAQSMKFCNAHKHYYLPGTLCPECQKVFTIIRNVNHYAGQNTLGFYDISASEMLLEFTRYSKDKKMFSEVKLGLEKELYDDFFFSPLKIAVDENEYPIGILFKRIKAKGLFPLKEFKNMQRLKAILVLYKKLLPHILNGSFIAADIDIFNSIAMHQEYKGEILILNISSMKCSSVLSPDKKEKIEFTKKLFARFLTNYISADDALKFAATIENSCIYKLILDIKAMNFSEEAVRLCLNSFCDIHKVPISTDQTVCPLCKQDGIPEKYAIVKSPSYFKNLLSTKAQYEGGEATLYQYGDHQVNKIFKDHVDLALKSKIIGKAIQKAPKFEEFNRSHSDIQFVTINNVLYSSDKNSFRLKGYTEDFIQDSFKISSLKDKEFVKELGYTRNDIVDILIKVCIGIEFLHSIGGFIGDLNGGNILIKGKTVYFIDLDGMSFDNVKNFVYTDMYIYPPSAESKNITQADDWYSFAIQAFYYLTYSHPFRGICTNKAVPENEVERMKLGISVLGNHEIKVPNISIGWSFIPKFLINFFLDTFEGKKRESMKEALMSYKTELAKTATSNLTFEELKRKFNSKLALSDNTYIDTEGYVVWCENRLFQIQDNFTYNRNDDFITFFTASRVIVLNDQFGSTFTFGQIHSGNLTYYSLESKFFFVSQDRTTLYVRSIDKSTGEVSEHTITRATSNKIIDFLVTSTYKFIFLEQEDDTHYAVYCNLDKLTSIDIRKLPSKLSSYMHYDEVSGKYLILLSSTGTTFGLVISKTGSYTTFTLPVEMSASNCFYSNTLYYINEDKICFYNLSNGKTNYISSCYVSSDSTIERKANKFIICTGDKAYMYLKL